MFGGRFITDEEADREAAMLINAMEALSRKLSKSKVAARKFLLEHKMGILPEQPKKGKNKRKSDGASSTL